MKNIHVLPTDKPSRLFKHNELGFKLLAAASHQIGQYNGSNQHIYITSSEKIKEGDWVLFEGNDTIKKAIDSTFTSGVNNIRIHADKKVFKIILTTDGDLIKDGVQSIDDEFLEWFVKNPSVDYIKTEKWLDDEGKVIYSRTIPKEETMKNIHVLPTNKPSRLIIQNGNKLILGNEEYSIIENRQHIYITSDEEIKEGDWFIWKDTEEPYIFKCIGLTDTDSLQVENSLTRKIGAFHRNPKDSDYGDWYRCYSKKIILTTDQDLIKDGVQAINNEFLKWFVQNPSCEEVEVIKTFEDYTIVGGKSDEIYYKIIIPKEEPLSYEEFRKIASNDLNNKFDTDCSKYSDGDDYNYFYSNSKYWEGQLKKEPKQETLEEAAEKHVEINVAKNAAKLMYKEHFIEGAKWQQEQDKNKYSEEDMIEAAKYGYNFHKTTSFPNQEFKDSCVRNTQQWLTTYKKK